MADRAVPNLPSRDLGATSAFYGSWGFVELFRDDGWLVLRRGALQLEFFRKDAHNPREHDFGACLRVADLAELYEAIRAAGVPETRQPEHPSLQEIRVQPWGQRMATALDPEGNLLRLIEDAG